MIIQILQTVGFFLIIMFLSANLLGLLVRGLFSNPELEKLEQEGSDFIRDEVKKSRRADKMLNITALILIILYFYALFHFWNLGVLAVALIIMAGRLPDLLWEIKNGRKVNPNLMKKDLMYYVTSFLPWVGLPLLYFSLY